MTAEEAIYHDDQDPLVNWDETDSEAGLKAAGFAAVQVTLEKRYSRRPFGEEHFNRWFAEHEEGRLSYGRRLQANGPPAKEVKKVAARYRRQLREKAVDWQTAVVYIIARKLVMRPISFLL